MGISPGGLNLASNYRVNDRFAPGSLIICDCGQMQIRRFGDLYYVVGSYYAGQYFIVCTKCNDKVRYEPEIVSADLAKGSYSGPRRIIW